MELTIFCRNQVLAFFNTIARTASSTANTLAHLVPLALTTLQNHPRRVTGVVAALMLGSGATAFAVSQLAPDVSTLPVQQVLEAVQPLNFKQIDQLDQGREAAPGQGLLSADSAGAAALTALAPATPLAFAVLAPFTLYRSDTTRSNDTAESLLRRLGLVDAQAAAFVRKNESVRNILLSKPGRSITAEADGNNRLLKLQARWVQDDSNNFQRLVIDKDPIGFTSRIETAPLQASSRLASGTIRSSLFAATDEARIPDSVATQLAEVFGSDIDFIRDLRKGDRFSVVYETLTADNEPLKNGRLVSAEFVNKGKTYQAIWFQEPGNGTDKVKGQYYTLDGNTLRKAFLTSPLEFSRVTSGFGMRVHPIARDWRAHKGVDYASPIGTPIRTVGDGVIKFAAGQNGYGNVVEVMHRDGKSTLYAHMNSIGVKVGQRVEQGDTIGTVGRTGWATGPHLHFEFRINGEHHDPLTIAQESNTVPLNAASRPAFNRLVANIKPQLSAAASIAQASAQ